MNTPKTIKVLDPQSRDITSILAYFYQWEKERAEHVFLRQPYGKNWKTYTWSEVGTMARRLAHALQGIGLVAGDKVGIVSKNCYQWIVTDLALMMGGFVSVPFYPNLTAKELNQVMLVSEAKILFVGKLDDWTSMPRCARRCSTHCIPTLRR